MNTKPMQDQAIPNILIVFSDELLNGKLPSELDIAIVELSSNYLK